jgi:hypothetical protein
MGVLFDAWPVRWDGGGRRVERVFSASTSMTILQSFYSVSHHLRAPLGVVDKYKMSGWTSRTVQPSHKRKRESYERHEQTEPLCGRLSKRRAQPEVDRTSPLMSFLTANGERSYYAIYQSICGYLEIQDIVNVTRTCSKLASLYTRLLDTQWNIDQRFLSRYFKNPVGFRTALGSSNAIIHRASAMEFFSRLALPDSQLEVLAQDGTQDDLCVFHEQEGYTTETDQDHRGPITYQRGGESTTKVVLMLCEELPLDFLLNKTAMTAAYNFITANKAYSIFAAPTFVYNQNFLTQHLDASFQTLHTSFRRLGWGARNIEDSKRNPKLREHFDENYRHVGDSKTWVIDFQPQVSSKTMVPDSVTECSFFDLSNYSEYDRCNTRYQVGTSFATVSVGAISFKHPALRYEYLY